MGFWSDVGGFVGGAIGTVVAPGAGTAIGSYAGSQAGGAIEGGSSSSAPCPGQPSNAAVTTMLRTASTAELAELRRLYAAANSGRPMPTDVFTLAKHALGGNDCAVSTTNLQSAGNQLRRYFLALVARYGAAPVTTAPQLLPVDPQYGYVDAASAPAAPAAAPQVPWYVWAIGIAALLVVTGVVKPGR